MITGSTAMAMEIEYLRQQLAERNTELKRINLALNDDRVDLTITAAEAITELRQQVTLLRDALRELVAVKRHKEISEIAEDASTRDYCGTQYQTRKIPAWKAAEQALAATKEQGK